MAESTTMDRLFEEPESPPPAAHQPRDHESIGSRLRWASPWLAMLVVAAGIAPFRDRWIVQVLLLGWILFAPGRLALTALRLRRLQVRRFPVYTIAMSLLFIMLTGVAVNGLGVALGDDRPLTTGPLWAGVAVAYLLLVAVAAAAPDNVRPTLSATPAIQSYWPLLLPLLAAAGALRLNAGHGSAVALTAMIALVAVWLVQPFLPGFTWRTASISVYAVSLAGMWSFSLRGDSVFGYDIVTEYFLANTTTKAGVWHLDHTNDAYGSLLSVTVLPASLHSVTGVAVLTLLKVVYPAIFALVPVAALRLSGRLLRVRWAYVAVGLIIGQSFFFGSLPSVTRQEIALVFFAAGVAALLESRGRAAWPVGALCGVGVVFSHYSTTYMAIALTGAATVFALIGRTLRRRPPVARTAAAFAVLTVGSIVWYRLLTESTSNVTNVIDTFKAQGLNLLPNRSGNALSTLISGNVQSALTPRTYASAIAERYTSNYPFVDPLPEAGRYPLTSVAAYPGGGVVTGLGGVGVTVISQVVNVLAVVGALLLTFGRRISTATRTIGLLSLGVLVFLAVVRVSGSAAVSYNQERAQIQAFVLLAPVAVWALLRICDFLRDRFASSVPTPTPTRRVGLLSAVAVVASTVLVINSAGLLSGNPTRDGKANLSAEGEDVARFNYLDLDLRGARWLAAANPGIGELTYADRYGELRMLAVVGNGRNILSDITPRTLNSRAWIYNYSANTQQHEARADYDGRAARYRYPAGYVTRFYDRVYTNGTAEVFHR